MWSCKGNSTEPGQTAQVLGRGGDVWVVVKAGLVLYSLQAFLQPLPALL